MTVEQESKQPSKPGKTYKRRKDKVTVEGQEKDSTMEGEEETPKAASSVEGQEKEQTPKAGSTMEGEKEDTPKARSNVEGKEDTPEVSSKVLKTGCKRQQKPPNMKTFVTKHRKFVPFEQLEDIYYSLLNDCEKAVVLKFDWGSPTDDISMTAGQLEQCLQGGLDATEIFKLLRKVLDDETVKHEAALVKRIIAQPVVDKGNMDLVVQTLVDALPKRNGGGLKRKTKLEDTIIHLPVFFEGEWIVVCFPCLNAQSRINLFCHKQSFTKVMEFALPLGAKVSNALVANGYQEITFSNKGVANTGSLLEPKDSALGALYFIEYYLTSQSNNLKKFLLKDNDVKIREGIIEGVKLGIVQILLAHKKNEACLPDYVEVLKKDVPKKRKNK